MKREYLMPPSPYEIEAGSCGDLRHADRAGRLEARQAEAARLAYWARRNRFYHQELARLFRLHVSQGARVLHVGCGLGDTLAAVRPARGLGIDLSPEVIERARQRHVAGAGKVGGPPPHPSHARRVDEADTSTVLQFEVADPECFALDETFDFVIIDQALADMHDIQASLTCIRRHCEAHTRLVLSHYNAMWSPVLRCASLVRLRRQTREQNWLGAADFENLLNLSGFELVLRTSETLLPKWVPGVSWVLNRVVAKFWPFSHLALTQLLVARPRMAPSQVVAADGVSGLTCSVVIPTRNERGNIADAVGRMPRIGARTEIIFVDGNSTDGTAEEIERVIANARGAGSDAGAFSFRFLAQGEGRGKGDAVRKGFAAATGDVLMILDADLTVPPEDLPRFFGPIADGTAEFINGTRLVYPMEDQAMRYLNKIGNRFFSMLFTWILGQRFRDTLCGTKALSRRNYQVIAANRSYFGDFDPFGDFDLIFGAAKANLKIIEVPVRYRARTYGETNIHRFRHGWLLLKMSWLAFRRLKMR